MATKTNPAADFSPAKTETAPTVLGWKEHRRLITESFHKTTGANLDLCGYCARARADLKATAHNMTLLQSKLPFPAAEFSKCATIGDCVRLRDPDVAAILPPKPSIWYLIAKLEPKELEAALAEEGVITPTMKRLDFQAWVNDHRGKEPKARAEKKVDVQKLAATFGTLKPEDREKFLAATGLISLANVVGMDVKGEAAPAVAH